MSTVGALLSLEITRVIADLDDRRALLVRLWGIHRHRWPMAEAAFSRWRTLRTGELDQLPPHTALAVDGFYEDLEAFLRYVRTTTDMPLHLDWAWRHHLVRLQVSGRRALDALGPPPDVPVPEVDRDGRRFLEAFAVVDPFPPAALPEAGAEE